MPKTKNKNKERKKKEKALTVAKYVLRVWEQQNDIIRIPDARKRASAGASSSVWRWRARIDSSRLGRVSTRCALMMPVAPCRWTLPPCNSDVTLSCGSSLKAMTLTEDSAFWSPWSTFHARVTEICLILSFIWQLSEWEVGAASRHWGLVTVPSVLAFLPKLLLLSTNRNCSFCLTAFSDDQTLACLVP